jgi:hypothetical protein
LSSDLGRSLNELPLRMNHGRRGRREGREKRGKKRRAKEKKES